MKRISCILISICLLMACFVPSFAEGTVSLQMSNVSCTYDSVSGRHHITLDVQVLNGSEALANQEVTLLMAGSQPGKISGTISFTYGGAAKEGYVYYLNQGNTGTAKRASFDFYVTLPETLTNVSDYLYVFSGGTAAAKVETSVDVPSYQIAVTAGENGSVKANGTAVSNGASVAVVEGKTVVFEAIADDGYVIDTVTYNSTPMVANAEEKYETSAVTANGTFSVTFKQDESKPSIAQTYESVFQSSGPQTINGKLISAPMSITFAKVVVVNGYVLKDFGMEFAKTEADLTAGNGKKCSATAGMSPAGNYGICFYGEFAKGTKYYVRPYAIYVKDEVETTVTGKILEITPNP